jgi:hypothetical protein
MQGFMKRAGLAAVAVFLAVLPAHAATAQLVQNGAEVAREAPALPSATDASANSPEQIKRAQTELRRLDCLKGRIDGKLGSKTRQALDKFWTSAKQPPAAEIRITDDLISALAGRGDNFCRPPRPFFAVGGRSGGNPAMPPFFPGARPGALPPPPPPPSAPAEQPN